jgi:type I restriction enzyme, S subunit
MMETIPLRHLAEVKVSNVDKKSVADEIPVRLCNYTDVYYQDVIDPETDFMAATATREQIREFSLHAGDILFTKDSETPDDIAVPAFIAADLPGVVSGYHLALVRADADRIEPRFLFRVIQSDYMREQFAVAASGVTRYGLTYGAIRGAAIPHAVSSLEKQRRIADFLDDQVIRIDQAMARRRIQHGLLTARHSRIVDSAISGASERAVRFKFLLRRTLQYGANEASSFDDPRWPRYIRITDITSEGDLRSDTFRSLPPEKAAPYILEAGDLLFARSGATVGKCFLFNDSSIKAAFAGYLIRAQVAGHLVLPEFIRYFTESAGYWSQIREGEVQATIQNMSAERYANIWVPLPSMDGQHRLVKMLNEQAGLNHRVRSEIATQLGLLQERKRALITAAVTGEFDVATASGRGVA